jgi:glycogen debranching enzyme
MLPSAESVSRYLCRLGHVRRLEDLGKRGPLDASLGRHSLYACLFGRDALRMALDLLDDFPAVARGTIRRLTQLQGVRQHPRSEEEPGRILHEHRGVNDPRYAELLTAWDLPYYGAVDTTPLYVSLIAGYCRRYGRGLLQEKVRDRAGKRVSIGTGLERALAWMDGRLRQYGYLAVLRQHPQGIANQVWEDSYDAYFGEDGQLLDPAVPYAPVAVQAYVYDALLHGAVLLDHDPRRAAHLRAVAGLLRRRVLAEAWLPDLETFAPALILRAGGTTPLRVVASSPAHMLASRLLDAADAADQRAALVARVLAPDMLAAAGIRTKSTTAARFAPGAYHNGSVWPVDTGVIADGLRRHGHVAEATDLEDRLLRACALVGGPVEFFRGDPDGDVAINRSPVELELDGARVLLEQPPQLVQGWTVTRLWRILRRRGLAPSPRAGESAARAA